MHQYINLDRCGWIDGHSKWYTEGDDYIILLCFVTIIINDIKTLKISSILVLIWICYLTILFMLSSHVLIPSASHKLYIAPPPPILLLDSLLSFEIFMYLCSDPSWLYAYMFFLFSIVQSIITVIPQNSLCSHYYTGHDFIIYYVGIELWAGLALF